MWRQLTFLLALLFATPQVAAQSSTLADVSDANCRLRVSLTSSSWIIKGFDPFSNTSPEATFSVSFVNEGGAQCYFTPVFVLDEPPFGLSIRNGSPLPYALVNLTETVDVTPRTGQSRRFRSQPSLILEPRETRTLVYKLAIDARQVRDSGLYTENVTLEAQDSNFRSFGGSRIVLGIEVVPAARIGLAGAYTMSEGQAVVDLGELKRGIAPVPLNLRVKSTGRYDISVRSANVGRLKFGSSDWTIPYQMIIGGSVVNMTNPQNLTSPGGRGFRREDLPIQFVIGDTSNRRAGQYSDIVTISIAAR